MKRRTLIIATVIISFLFVVFPANAAAITAQRSPKAQGHTQSQQVLTINPQDILNTLPDGHHDNFGGTQNQFSCRAEGWAADPDDRSLHLNITILSDGVEVAQAVADTFRPDLANAGVCTGGACSFSVDLWGLITPDEDHVITLQARDAQTGEWSNLYDTPKTLNCFEAQAQTFIVNSSGDLGDGIPGNGVCETTSPGECTLRAAIMESNANPGTDSINFNIPGAGPHTISPTYGFDFISDPVIIDGTTQPGFAGTPVIELDGSNAGPDAPGMFIYAGSSTVRGLVINRFAHSGIELQVSGGNVIQGNYIGTDITGTLAVGNGDYDGVLILTPNNIIGGTTLAARNIISGNKGQGIRMQGSDANHNIVQGNFIGTDVTGLVALGNGTDCCHSGIVLHLGASNNTIGGNIPGAGNVISGNTADGVTIMDEGTTGNIVAGNFIGIDVNGAAALANNASGVAIYSGATDNLIGGTTAAARNVISGNGAPGVNICCDGATRNLVKGNFIGTDVSGTLSLGNAGDGVSVYQSADNTIGGVEPGARNLISGNQSHGIGIYDAGTTGNSVQGNYVGTDVTGMTAIGNSLDGVVICCGGASGNTVGGTALGAGNLISGNDGGGIGIYDDTTANVIEGNWIGTDATGTGSLGNGANGIGIAGGPTNNTIGGTTNGARNTIAFNGANGVSLTADAGTGNVISSNSIYSNGSLGIDLGENGVTLNNLFDADSGPNNLQNFPVITDVKSKGKGITIQGLLISAGNTTFQIQFFSSTACDASSYGEGQNYLGSTWVTTPPVGRAQFKISLQAPIANGSAITATATDPTNNTSEFSRCVQVAP